MPDWRAILRGRLATAGLPPATELDVVEELAQHLDDQYQEFCVGGLSEAEAAVRVQAELDGTAWGDDLSDVFGRG